MIDFVRGPVAYTGGDFVVLDVGGIGYQVYVTHSHSFQHGDRVMFFTHYIVREDAQLLYGFVAEEERDLFRLLLEVSGVGARVGMAVLSNSDLHQFIQAINQEDIVFLVGLPGIGKKTAQRMILDLKDKLKKWSTTEVNLAPAVEVEMHYDVRDALVGLGYSESEAKQAVEKVKKEFQTESLSTEAWIKHALQMLIRV